MTTPMTSPGLPHVEVPVEVLRMAYWTEGPAAERDALLGDYLSCLERLTDPQLLDECLVVGLLHDAPEVRRQAQAAAARLSPELSAEATGWTLGDPDETVRAAALASAVAFSLCIISANIRIEVSGVLSSWETLETKSVFFWASASWRRASAKTAQPPKAIAVRAAATRSRSVRRIRRAFSCNCSGRTR